ncbi:hypothetical protein VNO77_10009 [Canavalia gladiata]|uniref:Uncharacterized protein n=1 Tax=Canavalia gladiata TaxID=3824 RepID=A0AAN9MAH3_CANGL
MSRFVALKLSNAIYEKRKSSHAHCVTSSLLAPPLNGICERKGVTSLTLFGWRVWSAVIRLKESACLPTERGMKKCFLSSALPQLGKAK